MHNFHMDQSKRFLSSLLQQKLIPLVDLNTGLLFQNFVGGTNPIRQCN